MKEGWNYGMREEMWNNKENDEEAFVQEEVGRGRNFSIFPPIFAYGKPSVLFFS
jgi:hypothetical protein